ncbi:hypothetical protein Y697_00625 [Mesotoga sp. BH458_6_3_2_1]|nr:hypothetical protein Y697_00625 [Mesotoga sp. BH458_6_3_2_1]
MKDITKIFEVVGFLISLNLSYASVITVLSASLKIVRPGLTRLQGLQYFRPIRNPCGKGY